MHLLTNPNNGNTPFTVNDEARIGGGHIVFSSTDFGNNTAPPTHHIYVTDLAGHIQTDITPGDGRHNRAGQSQRSADQFPAARHQRQRPIPDVLGGREHFDPNSGTNTPVGDATLYTYDRTTGDTSDHRDHVRQRRR